jgi:hypothetical protein
MEMKNSYKTFGGKLHGKNPLGRPNSILEAILKWIGEKHDVKNWIQQARIWLL